MRNTKLARSGGLLLAAVLIAANLSGSALAQETGSISGTFTDPAGVPMPGVTVELFRWDDNVQVGTTATNAAGKYTFSAVQTQYHRVLFRPADHPEQYAKQALNAFAAKMILVQAGVTSIVDDQLLPFGTFTGRLTHADGTGIAQTTVRFSGPGPETVTTDGDGYYTAHVRPGSYYLWFYVYGNGQPSERIPQYIPGKEHFSQATNFEVAGGQTVTVNDTEMPTGLLTGQFTDEFGSPMANLRIQVRHLETNFNGILATTDTSGNWRRRVQTGTHIVQFISLSRGTDQYAYGQRLREHATVFTVGDGQSTTVNDSRLPTGSLRISAKDALTGKPVGRFTTAISPHLGQGDSDSSNATETYTQVAAGTYTVSTSAYGYHSTDNAHQAVVTAGVQTEIEILLQPRTRIDATIVDAQTGAPVEGVCLFAGKRDNFVLPATGPGGCYPSLADGRTMLEIADAGDYQLLALPRATLPTTTYGAQWVGATGGKGSQVEAKLLTVTAGQVSTAPLVKLDRAGIVHGKVTSSVGEVPHDGMVSLVSAESAGYGATAPITSDGSYQLDFLGPYAWPLRFTASFEAVQFSGGTGNRHDAQRVQISTSAATRYDHTLQPSIAVDVTVPEGNGSYCEARVVNAISGDWLGGAGGWGAATPYPFYLVKGQIKIQLTCDSRTTWHGGASFGTASSISVTGPMTVAFNVGPNPPRLDPPATPQPTPTPVPRPTSTPPSLPPVPRP